MASQSDFDFALNLIQEDDNCMDSISPAIKKRPNWTDIEKKNTGGRGPPSRVNSIRKIQGWFWGEGRKRKGVGRGGRSSECVS